MPCSNASLANWNLRGPHDRRTPLHSLGLALLTVSVVVVVVVGVVVVALVVCVALMQDDDLSNFSTLPSDNSYTKTKCVRQCVLLDILCSTTSWANWNLRGPHGRITVLHSVRLVVVVVRIVDAVVLGVVVV